MLKRSLTVSILPWVLALAWLGPPAESQETPQITGALSNFDVLNTGKRPYNDLELQILGRLDPDCVTGWYPGWGAPPKVRPGTAFGPGFTIIWTSPRDPIGPGRMEHFGLRFACEGDFAVRGFWSVDGRPVEEIPLPWQSWQPRPGMIWDVIRMPGELAREGAELRPPFAGPVAVERQFVTLPEAVPLEALNWKETEAIVRRAGREWQTFDDRPLPLLPGDRALLKVPVRPGDGAALVRYTVTSGRQVVGHFVNEASLEWGAARAKAAETLPSAAGFEVLEKKPARLEAEVCYPRLPAPEVEVTGSQDVVTGGMAFTNYSLKVTNRSAFPDALFTAAPDLPPCGLNTDASRTWVDILRRDGTYLYGYCALSSSAGLGNLWFTMPRGEPPPDCVSVTLTDRRCDLTYESACAPTGDYGPGCIDFETPLLGTTYSVGDVFTDAGATVTVEPFQWSNGVWTSGGQATINDRGEAGGVGQEVVPNNVNLRFAFPVRTNALFLLFAEHGGNINIEVNGDLRNKEDFAELHGAVIGGVDVNVTNGFGHDRGTLRLNGEIHSFSIGGQELFIDHVCITETPEVDAAGTWVMAHGVGGTPLYEIDADGFTDYTEGNLVMNDAPFGGRLGFRLGSASVIPTDPIYYYRFRYRHETEPTTAWHDFTETVAVHYQRETAGSPPSFPIFVLGPHDISGMNLYRFRPAETQLKTEVGEAPGETVSWPKSGFSGDIYRGFLNTSALHLEPGKYLIRLEIYHKSGVQTPEGAGTFRFVVPTETLADGEIKTQFADAADVIGDGLEFDLQVDNRPTSAVVDEPMIGSAGAGDCGFLRYLADDERVDVAFHATHPAHHALFSFGIKRGPNTVTLATVSRQEVTALTAGTAGVFPAYGGDALGNFQRGFTVRELLETCRDEAAFAEWLHVYAKATRGWRHRISSLDSHASRAFALTPR